jgi:hypothetical protein
MLLSSPAYVTGKVKPAKSKMVMFVNRTTGEEIKVKPNKSGDFKLSLPFGLYTVQCGELEQTLAILSGKHYNLQLNSKENCDFKISTKTKKNAVTIELTAKGKGTHKFKIKTSNLDIFESKAEITLDLTTAKTVNWRAKIVDTNKPWVAVVIPDGDNTWQKEAFGQVKFASK